jgi:hypothetical protein
MTGRVPPENDIGPYFKAAGAFVMVVLAAFVLIGRWRGTSETWISVAVIGGFILLLSMIWRPRFLDRWMKEFATWLPFTRFDKNASPPSGGGA